MGKAVKRCKKAVWNEQEGCAVAGKVVEGWASHGEAYHGEDTLSIDIYLVLYSNEKHSTFEREKLTYWRGRRALTG